MAGHGIETNPVATWERQRDLKSLVWALGDGSAKVREDAALALGRIGDRRAVDPLVPILGDEIPQVREAAVRALKQLGEPLGDLVDRGLKGSREAMDELASRQDPRTLVPLVNALKARDGDLREAAAWVLRAIGNPLAVDPLIAALNDSDDDVRTAAAWALVNIGSPRSTKPLLAALRDFDPDVREAAAWGLAKTGDRRAVDPLIEALGDRFSKVRESAAIALQKLGEPLGDLIVRTLSGSEAARQELANRKDPRAIAPLVYTLDGLNASVSEAAARALGTIGDPRAVDPLVKALLDAAAEVRLAAAEALGKIGDRRAVDPLLIVLKDRNGAVRHEAARALGRIGDPRAATPLLDTMADPDADVRDAAAAALEGLGEPLGRRIQEALKGSPDALGMLARSKDERSIPVLLQILDRGGAQHRRAAARVLSATGDPRALDGLIAMAGGWNPGDRLLALALLVDMSRRATSPGLPSVVLRVLLLPASLTYCALALALAGWGIRRRVRRDVKKRRAR